MHPECRTEGVPDTDRGMAGNPGIRDRQQASGGYDIDNESSGNEVPGQPEGSQDSSGSLPDNGNSSGGSGLQSIGGGTEA